ncbi:MAG: 50S ribosomal protein L10 [Candidatus Doudnabacteria bacterium]|nr:50S ribosomal protein L10 [Candidatus Doudnabacteria bacterium]
MPKSKQQKDKDLAELISQLKTAKAAVFTDYKGTSVKDITKFRQALRKDNIFSKVYKLTLVKMALKEAGVQGQISDYKAPVILSVSREDETGPARQIKLLAKDIKSLNVLEGLLEGKIVGKDMVMALADLPGKDQLRGMVLGTIKAPISGFVNVMAGNLRGLINVLNAMAAK